MKEDAFQIYIDQLREGQQKKIHETVTVDFLNVLEKDLSFKKNVSVDGEAYLAGDMLVLHLSLAAVAVIPCSVCNEAVDVDITLPEVYHAEPLDEVKSGIFDFQDVVREAILLEVPPFAECNGGRCLKRMEIEKYLASPDKTIGDEGYKPFADL